MLALATHIPVREWMAEDPETILSAIHILQEQEKRRK